MARLPTVVTIILSVGFIIAGMLYVQSMIDLGRGKYYGDTIGDFLNACGCFVVMPLAVCSAFTIAIWLTQIVDLLTRMKKA